LAQNKSLTRFLSIDAFPPAFPVARPIPYNTFVPPLIGSKEIRRMSGNPRSHEIASLLAKLVQIPSINPMGRAETPPDLFFEHRLTDFLESWLREQGLRPVRQSVAPLRENLIAIYDPPTPPTRTILFEVHQDTVPVEGMTVPPFGGEIRDGRVFGRGACDVKGGMAVMLGTLQRLQKDRLPGARVVLALTVDEEHTFLGVQKLMEKGGGELAQLCGARPDLAIIAEPTDLRIVEAHKGVSRWLLTTKGVPCHSSRPEMGQNAIYRMAKVLTILEEHAGTLSSRPGDPVLGPGTLSVGRIQGGISVNTVPDRCAIEIDRRIAPGESPASADKLLRSALETGLGGWPEWLDLPQAWMSCPGLDGPSQKVAKDALALALRASGIDPVAEAVPYGTDASTIAEAGIPSVVFGPGDIRLAHTAAESIPIAELGRAEEVLIALARQ
jgi:acetylornithine deacetylase